MSARFFIVMILDFVFLTNQNHRLAGVLQEDVEIQEEAEATGMGSLQQYTRCFPEDAFLGN